MTSRYTRRELMVVAAAREIRDREVVFVGMRLPLLGFGLAKATHAPDAVGLFENGVIRDRPAETFIYTMGDPPNIVGAVACLGLVDVMSLLQVREATGFPITIDDHPPATATPSADELAYIRHADPEGFWTGDSMKSG